MYFNPKKLKIIYYIINKLFVLLITQDTDVYDNINNVNYIKLAYKSYHKIYN